ncbi:Dyp-type peroxidase [Prosthecomicrobium pneumaticum]|uniref:Deferrochelatase/peroxidase EfeB n=1 Tax=Prosthecomicrobium pneumaticum TaxID=81895 RepID=A0A7W9FLV0_9HYPH|nr:Dyp-type peroxidase [Prosthecomicrobium pneumaticum]MBB5753055.1 deferrochelatase/peroxidase EfeB [Prosthecomicrobium pneumaticum]
MTETSRPARPALSRRGLLFGAAAGTVGATLAATTASPAAAAAPPDAEDLVDLARTYPFYGTAEQAGIRTPPQRHIVFMTFDLVSPQRADLQHLLARWSAAAAQMMKGGAIGRIEPARPDAVGLDTGEALGLGPAALTVTFGLGPAVFSDRYGLAAQRPAGLRPLAPLPSDALKPEFSGGDLSVQACADDPQVAYHAVRDLARIARTTGTAATRFAVLGFGRASAGPGQTTPRNLFGYKDGTRNIRGDADFDRFVWIGDGPQGIRGGSYQVVRKIEMHIENWDTDRIGDQNAVFGRFKQSGAPLSGRDEFDTPDFALRDAAGAPVIPPASHVALAAPENNDGVKILRRSYNYTDGINALGQLDAGLLFISYQNDPAHFERIQARLGAADRLSEYVSHIGSAIFFVPPAAPEGSYIGAPLFA